ncbi:NADH-quinone oxidoreductase subunit J [Paenibacillus albiflavus]|uniref:NADH-quinone oxidoreductase subunit J n=1 Tax=Paenibacillus albiflavus TaxID=2545760 RepID=A0A4R4EF31_9BACL|nr:NADH-quinone oxidoreductase subunit J [Paenibacillus albiflavus]TCZ76801.1 NADH-quinone oxidoreductase subunit J [Paenibacillus albiflavus]
MLSGLSEFFSSGANWVFLLFAMMAIGGALYMISFTRVVHMLMSAALTFISLAGIYFLLEAEFVAVAQILIYAGAISILMIFGIMMTNHRSGDEGLTPPLHTGLAFIVVLAFFGILFFAIQNTLFQAAPPFDPGNDNTLELGKLFFSKYVIPFELMSVLLTVAFIGAVIIAKREEGEA